VTPVHDADGNLVDDGTKTLEWDGENRLKSVRRKSDNALIATYTYDDQSRRVRKETTPLAPQGASDEVFMWDGWNVVGELSNNAGTFTPVRYYTWGSDLSGTQQGAGGVGGLVMEKDAATGEVYFPCFDGNGNVTNLVAAGSGTVAAAYEYDPFGKVVSSSGSYAGANPYRFSTKPVDAETGYSYYGYRFYNPVDGRWINRDPLGDSAFFNSQVRNKTEKEYISLKDAATHSQYVFLKNNGISSIDSHGLKRWLVDYLHTSVVVESWNDKCCRTGYLQIDFGPAIGWGALLLIPDFGFWCPGVVVISPTEKPSGSPINSTCKQDQILIDTAELLSVNPPSYSLWAFNCRHFSAVILGVGL
jgi:RHS repeat-associated protein